MSQQKNKATSELRRKISKLGTASLVKKFTTDGFEGEEREIALEFIRKRNAMTEQDIATCNGENMTLVIKTDEEMKEIQTLEAANSVDVESMNKSKEKPKQTNPVKVEKTPTTKKFWTDPENNKQLDKSAFIRKCIRKNREIKPKELNEKLAEVGFSKAYHSEIQRCREVFGIIPNQK